MRYASLAAMAAIPILLAACQNEAEETPDIEEAIPMDETDDSADAPDGEDMTGGADAADDDANPPPTMESGSNEDPSIYGGEDEGSSGPPGSKLQLADPVE
ncbi:hypothetical protein [Erythrobacter sp. KY5]|uniref:hypothetical protein n=1 Tax=Erythrobacter sp. KY5 TaxID=2011159 RepID=UPI0013A6B8EF|nr:hypothetical protein [Erythrobacter sp. KY5]